MNWMKGKTEFNFKLNLLFDFYNYKREWFHPSFVKLWDKIEITRYKSHLVYGLTLRWKD